MFAFCLYVRAEEPPPPLARNGVPDGRDHQLGRGARILDAATLQVGEQTATGIRDANDPTIVNSVQFRDTGIVLRVTPRIGKSGMVFVDVNQEVSSAIPTTTSGIDSPTIQQRRFESTVAVANGETVALGGLIRANRTRGRSGVPILSAIPLLGAPFRNTTTTVRRTELIVFLTPRILRSSSDAVEETQDFVNRLERLRDSRFIQSARD